MWHIIKKQVSDNWPKRATHPAASEGSSPLRIKIGYEGTKAICTTIALCGDEPQTINLCNVLKLKQHATCSVITKKGRKYLLRAFSS